MVRARLFSLPLLVLACSSPQNPQQLPVQPPRGASAPCKPLVYASTSRAGSLTSIGRCSERGASPVVSRSRVPHRELFVAGVSVQVGTIHGARSPSTLWQPLDEARTLLRICVRRAGVTPQRQQLGVLVSIASSGKVRFVRSERIDMLGRCVSEVLAGVEFAPMSEGSGSTEVLLGVGFRPSPWTLWVRQ